MFSPCSPCGSVHVWYVFCCLFLSLVHIYSAPPPLSRFQDKVSGSIHHMRHVSRQESFPDAYCSNCNIWTSKLASVRIVAANIMHGRRSYDRHVATDRTMMTPHIFGDAHLARACNHPPGYEVSRSCSDLPKQLISGYTG